MSYFKPGAPVIVLYNISANIHNGTQGCFLRKLSDNTVVIRVGEGKHVILNVSWLNVDDDGHSIGSRSQMLLKLHWAATVHKAQGLTLDKVIIHSSYEFTAGLLYTALARVKSIHDLQVLGLACVASIPMQGERNSGHAKARAKKWKEGSRGRGKKETLSRKPLDFEKRPPVFTVEFVN